MLFYAAPIIYPVGYLPPWARKIVFLNPFTQILQDVRAIVLYTDLPSNRITVADCVRNQPGATHPDRDRRRLAFIGASLFRREEPYFAERV